jgi:hypothetical protein
MKRPQDEPPGAVSLSAPIFFALVEAKSRNPRFSIGSSFDSQGDKGMQKLVIALTTSALVLGWTVWVVKAAPLTSPIGTPSRNSPIEKIGCVKAGDNCPYGYRIERHGGGSWSCEPCGNQKRGSKYQGWGDRDYEPRRYQQYGGENYEPRRYQQYDDRDYEEPRRYRDYGDRDYEPRRYRDY